MELTERTFLTAHWRHLVMLNYVVDPVLVEAFVPKGTELDFWNGRCFISLVGFLFQDTKLLGLPVPFHRSFEELNLRFYVRRKGPEGWRRGVAFIKEIVPRFMTAWVARVVYNENYISLPMRRSFHPPGHVRYEWKFRGRWNSIGVATVGNPTPVDAGSEEEFITEHYWGYAAKKNGASSEYRVEHPRWRVWQVRDPSLDCDIAALYGPGFANYMTNEPSSAFLAEGSPVTVYRASKLD